MKRVEDAVWRLQGLALASEAARTPAEGTFFEHELAGGVDRPVVTFARATKAFRQFDETLVQRQVVTNAVFPSLEGRIGD